jgi:DNA-binding MarR family transcriptional regulator
MADRAAPAEGSDAIRAEGISSVLGYRLRRAQISVFQKFIAEFEALRIRPAEYSVLLLIGDNPGRKQIEIAEVLGIKRANFVPLLHDLEGRGLVKRSPSVEDRRANALHLTEEGEALLARARVMHAELENELVARLGGAGKRDQLLALLDKLT